MYQKTLQLGVFDKILVEFEYLPLRHGHHHEVIGVDFPDDLDFLMSSISVKVVWIN